MRTERSWGEKRGRNMDDGMGERVREREREREREGEREGERGMRELGNENDEKRVPN